MRPETIQALGWSLIHFLWQGALVALALELGLQAMRERSARARYLVRCAGLGTMALLPPGTFLWLRATAQAAPAAALDDPRALLAMLEAAERGAGPMSWLVVGWALGAAACATRVMVGWLCIRGLQRAGAGSPLPLTWQLRFDHLARRTGTRAAARVIDSAALAAPTVIGWLKPVVLIPARALSGLSAEQLEAVLAHELAHVRRHDYLVNLVQSALEALLFYHPAVWWVSNGIRAEREFCCDDAALSLSGDRIVYARALATLEGWRSAQPQFGLSTLGGPLMTRIQRLIGTRPASRPARTPLTALGALLLLCSATVWAHGQPDPDGGQDPDQLRAIRAHLDLMQVRLGELRAMLDEASPAGASWTPAGSEGGQARFEDANDGEQVEWIVEGDDDRRYRVIVKGQGKAGDAAGEWHAAKAGGEVHAFGPRDELVEVEIPQADDGEPRPRVFVRGKHGRLEATDHQGEWKGRLEESTDGKAAWWTLLKEQPRAKEHVKVLGKLEAAPGDGATARLHEHLMELYESGDLDLDIEQLHSHLMKLYAGEQGSKLEQLHGKLSKLLHGEGHSKTSGEHRTPEVRRFELEDGGQLHVEVIVGGDDSFFGDLELSELKIGGKLKVLLRGDGESDVQVLELGELKGGKLRSKDGSGKLRFRGTLPLDDDSDDDSEDDSEGDEADGDAHVFFGKPSGDGDGQRNHVFFRTESDDEDQGGHHFFFRQGDAERSKVQRRVLRLNEATGEALQLRASPGTYQLRMPRSLKVELRTDCELDTDVEVEVECEETRETKPAPGQIV